MSDALSKKLLLVGWDAADWQIIRPLLDSGRMPHLAGLVSKGASGSLQTLQPMLSPLLWTSIATGKRGYHHGILGFMEPTPERTGLRPASSSTRKCKAIWNILAENGLRCVATGWFASHPAESINGACVSNQFPIPVHASHQAPWPVASGSVQPAGLSASLADLRLHPAEVTGEMLQSFIPKVGRLDQRDPEVRRLLGSFAQKLAATLTIHAVATALMEEKEWDFCTVFYDAIDTIGHDFMPFRPPRMPTVPTHLFEVFGEVMDAVYVFHDQMLGRLLELAGPDAHVLIVSDHGFLNGADRPRAPVDPAAWHRDHGVFALAGPGIAHTEIHGATLLDIAPTVLALFGFPVGADMEGRVLLNAFAEPPDVARIPSWEQIGRSSLPDGEAGTRGSDPEAEAASLRQLVELGYLEPPGQDVARDITHASAEQQFNLACTYMEGGHLLRALSLAQDLAGRFPNEARYVILAGQAAVAACDAAGLRQAITALEALQPNHRQLHLFRAFECESTGDTGGALRHFLASGIEEGSRENAWVLCRVGRAQLRLRRWAEAERAFRKALAIDAESAEAHYGLSVALPRQGMPREGVEHGLRSVALKPDAPLAHFQLGAVLSKLSWYEQALAAFTVCVTLLPDFAIAHRYLSLIHERLGQSERAASHRDRAARILAAGIPQPTLD